MKNSEEKKTIPENFNRKANTYNPDELSDNAKPLKAVNNFKNKVNSKINVRSLTLYDAICSKGFAKNKLDKMLVEPCGEAYRSKFSCDYIIKFLSEFDNIKMVLLNNEQRLIFNY